MTPEEWWDSQWTTTTMLVKIKELNSDTQCARLDPVDLYSDSFDAVIPSCAFALQLRHFWLKQVKVKVKLLEDDTGKILRAELISIFAPADNEGQAETKTEEEWDCSQPKGRSSND